MLRLVLYVMVGIMLAGVLQADEVDEYCRSVLKREQIPGMTVAVVRNGTIARVQGYGFSNLEHSVPAKPETVYQSGSVGKQFTATAVMMLVEEGRIGLDDPVRRYFPDAPESWSKITVRNLLTHTSGIPDYTEESVDFRKDYTEDELLKILEKLPLDFQPGEKWSYSNSGYMLLGFLIHKVSGKFYGDFLQDRVFGPLEMKNTRIISESDIIPNRAAGYELKDGKLANQEWVAPTLNTTADGALYFTALDVARWDAALYGERLLKKESLRQMWTPVTLNNGTSYPYGFGWGRYNQRGYTVIGHTGHWQGFSAGIFRYADFGLTVIVLTNLADVATARIAQDIAGLVEPPLRTPGMLAPVPASGDSDEIAAKLKQMLGALAAGKESPLLFPAFLASLYEEQKKQVAGVAAKTQDLEFLACDPVHDEPVELYGGKAVRYCSFRIVGGPEPNTLTAGLTDDGRITEFSLRSDSD